MPTAEISIHIDRPVAEVFAYAIDIERLHEWVGVIQESWPTSGNPPEVGATYVVKAKVMGKVMEIPSQVVAYEPNRLHAYQAWGSLPYVSTMVFEETEAGTRVTEQIRMESEGWFPRFFDQIKLRVSKRSHLQSLDKLKVILEGAEVAVVA